MRAAVLEGGRRSAPGGSVFQEGWATSPAEPPTTYTPPSQPYFVPQATPGPGPGQLPRTGPPAPSVRSDRRFPVKSLVLVIVAVGLAALVAVSINYYFGTPKKTYEGASMSFQYTARWNKVDPTALNAMEGMDLGFLTQNSEVIVADTVKAGGVSNFFVVERLQADMLSWNTVKEFQDILTARFNRMQAAATSSGISFSAPTFGEVTVGDNTLVSLSYHVSKDERVLAVEEVYVPRDPQSIAFKLATPNLKTASAQMQDIIDTVKLWK